MILPLILSDFDLFGPENAALRRIRTKFILYLSAFSFIQSHLNDKYHTTFSTFRKYFLFATLNLT